MAEPDNTPLRTTRASQRALRHARLRGMTYLDRVPAAVPPGQVLVHNQVRPARRGGTRGFRFWLQAPPADNLEVCPCRCAPELPEHYRIEVLNAHEPLNV